MYGVNDWFDIEWRTLSLLDSPFTNINTFVCAVQNGDLGTQFIC